MSALTRNPDPYGEWEFLATLLLYPGNLAEYAEAVRPEDFADVRLAALWRRMLRIEADGAVADLGTVVHDVEAHPGPDDLLRGDLLAFPNAHAAPADAALPGRVARIREASAYRRVLDALLGGVEMLRAKEGSAAEVQERVLAMIMDAEVDTGRRSERWADMVDGALAGVRDRIENPADIRGATTGLVDLDRLTRGLRPTKLYVIGARPGMGKTGLILQMALAAAASGVGVGGFELEMDGEELGERALSGLSGVPGDALTTGRVDRGREWRALLDAQERCADLPILIDDSPMQSITSIRMKARRWKRQMPCLGLVFVDYAQLVLGTGGPRQSRENVVAEVTRGLKVLAKELRVAVVALGQLNRDLEKRQSKRPETSDLRESGQIEQDADVIMFIYRDEVYNPESPDKGVAEIIVRKQRGGGLGTVRAGFHGPTVRFRDLDDRREEPPRRVTSGGARPWHDREDA